MTVKFVCEACALEGEVENPGRLESISCPDCNSSYVYWPEGMKLGEKHPWKCVVRAYFKKARKE